MFEILDKIKSIWIEPINLILLEKDDSVEAKTV